MRICLWDISVFLLQLKNREYKKDVRPDQSRYI